MKSAGLPKTEMAGRNLSVPYAPPRVKRIDSPRNRASKFMLQPHPIKLTDSRLKKDLGMMMSCQEPGNLTASLCDLNFCFGKGDIYLFTECLL